MRFAPLALAALCALILFIGLDRPGFLDAREARDAEVVRELVRRREWLTPLYADEALFEKPLFAYAPELLARGQSSLPPRGASPLRSREFRAIAALLLVLITALGAAQQYGVRAGGFAALVLTSAIGLPLSARTDGAQVYGALFGWCGCVLLARAVFQRGAPRAWRLVLAYSALALALLVAGPLPALWPLGGLALYAVLARDRAAWSRARPAAGLTVLLGAALPWYGAMWQLHGTAFLSHAFAFPYAGEPTSAWYVAPLLAVSYLVVAFHPWSAMLPEAMMHAASHGTRTDVRRRDDAVADRPPADARRRGDAVAGRSDDSVAYFYVTALVAAVVPIALVPGAPLSAVLPVLPAAAILCARTLEHLFEDPARLARPLARSARMLAVVGTASALLTAVAATRIPEAASDLRMIAAIAFLTSWLPLLASWRGSHRLAALLFALPVALGAPIAFGYALPEIEGYLSARTVALAMNQQTHALSPVALPGPPPATLRLYGDRNLVVTPFDRASLERLRGQDGYIVLAFPPAREIEVARQVGTPLEILNRNPSLVLARIRFEPPAR